MFLNDSQWFHWTHFTWLWRSSQICVHELGHEKQATDFKADYAFTCTSWVHRSTRTRPRISKLVMHLSFLKKTQRGPFQHSCLAREQTPCNASFCSVLGPWGWPQGPKRFPKRASRGSPDGTPKRLKIDVFFFPFSAVLLKWVPGGSPRLRDPKSM